MNLRNTHARQTTQLLTGLVALLLLVGTAQAQYDPAPRQLVQVGFEQSLRNDEPLGAYGFYYWNQPNVPATNMFLRLVIVPVYLDTELAFKGLLGEHTDLAVGAFGGLYYNSYYEVDHGNYNRHQSFEGDGGGGSVSLYHRFNPSSEIPLTGVLRGTVNYALYDNTSDTDNNFDVPNDQAYITLRTGLRWGGVEPVLNPVLAMELSGWYELEQRTEHGLYGYAASPYRLEATTQRIFGRGTLRFTTFEAEHYIVVGLQAGTAFEVDRLGCYRLGGMLDYTKEFPLNIPGYAYQELSAKDFGLLNASYTIPFGNHKEWNVTAAGAVALCNYVKGTGQSGAFNSGLGGGLGYSAPSRRWKVTSLFGYGFQAQRSTGDGGYSAGLAFQYNFGPTKMDSDYAFEELQKKYSGTK